MIESLAPVGIFLLVLVALPFLIKWIRQRLPQGDARAVSEQGRLVSALAVGPHQRVVTVEIGPEGARTLLTLGVTEQSITCLHSVPAVRVDRSLPAV